MMRIWLSFVKKRSNRSGWPVTFDKRASPPGENVTDVLDYNEDPELAQAIANIPPRSDDVEMQDLSAPPGFKPEVSHTGYDHNLVQHLRTQDQGLIPQSPKEKTRCWMKTPQAKAPGNGRPGLDGNAGHPITKK